MVTPLPLVYAPNEIFRKKATNIDIVDNNLRSLIDRMIKTLYVENAVGLGANMVGILKRIVVIDLQENHTKNPQVFINPEITWYSDDYQIFNEASVCFPGISANIKRPNAIRLTYVDYDGEMKEFEAQGFLASVLQHEIDYLNGKIFLDYLSKLKSDMLLKKMKKHMKLYPPHIHGEGCKH